MKLRSFLLLHQLVKCLRDSPVVRIVLLSLGLKCRSRRRLRKRAGIAPRRTASFVNGVPQKRLPSNHLPRILTKHNIRPAQTTPRACTQRAHRPTLLGARPSKFSQGTLGRRLPATKTVSRTHEAFASVALADQSLVLVSQFIPQSVELMVMLAPFIVRQLMQHSINNLLQRQEQISVIVIPQANANLVSAINIQAQQVPFRWQEFSQDLNAPASFAHDGFHSRGDSAEQSEGCIAAWETGEVLVAVEERFVFFELGRVVALDVGGSAFFGGSVAAGERGSAVWGHFVHAVRPEVCYARSESEPVASSSYVVEIRSSRW